MRAAQTAPVLGWGTGILCLFFATAQASTGGRASEPRLAPIDIRLVHSSDPSCAGLCSDWLSLEGPIGLGSATSFAHVMASLGSRRLPVLINSPGGSVTDAMAIGRMIRANKLDVAVSKTVFSPCSPAQRACHDAPPPAVTVGTPATTVAMCASACSFVLAGGVHRYVPVRAVVGVHQFRTYRMGLHGRPGMPVATPESTYLRAQHFFATMGIAPALMTMAEGTATNSMHWLSLAELFATRMDTEGKDGAYLIAHAGEAKPSLAMPKVAPLHLETAKLVTTDPQDTREHLDVEGHVAWSLDAQPPNSPRLTASITLGQDVGDLSVTMQREASAGARWPAYRMVLVFHPRTGGPLQHIMAVGLPAVRDKAGDPALDLQGVVNEDGPDTFDVELPASGPDAWQNQVLLTTGDWFELPLITYPLRKLTVIFERGISGAEIEKRWQAASSTRANP